MESDFCADSYSAFAFLPSVFFQSMSFRVSRAKRWDRISIRFHLGAQVRHQSLQRAYAAGQHRDAAGIASACFFARSSTCCISALRFISPMSMRRYSPIMASTSA